MELILILKIVGITLGLLLAAWGLFHQLIVGGAVTMFKDLETNGSRLLVMSWVAQGAFMSFAGLLSSVMLLLHDIQSAAVHTVLIMCGLSMLFLFGHVMVTGYSTHIKPVRIGAICKLLYGAAMITIVILT